MTIEEYLKGKVAITVDDTAIASILVDRQISAGVNVSTLTKKEKDLCRADLYMWCATTPSVRNSSSDSDGNWKHSDGGFEMSMTDRKHFREMANEIYTLYGEKTSDIGLNNFKILPL